MNKLLGIFCGKNGLAISAGLFIIAILLFFVGLDTARRLSIEKANHQVTAMALRQCQTDRQADALALQELQDSRDALGTALEQCQTQKQDIAMRAGERFAIMQGASCMTTPPAQDSHNLTKGGRVDAETRRKAAHHINSQY